MQRLRRAGARFGWHFSDAEAHAFAKAILSPDEKVRLREQVPREVWEQDGYQEWIKKNVIRKLVSEAIEREFVPLALPERNLYFYEHPAMNSPIPDDVIAAGHSWDFVEIEYFMYVRRAQ